VTAQHIGSAYAGLTNRELAAGRGTFVNDIQLPGMAYLVVLRSTFAHARIVSVDTSAAEAVDGVLAVMTGAEAKQVFNPIPEGWNTAEVGAKHVDWYPLVPDRVRYVGEAVAAVVAESRHVAQLASRLIDVEYEPLDPVTDPEAAMQDGSPLVEPSWEDNLLTTRDWTTGDVDRAFATASRTASGRVVSQRITGVSIEPRGVVASYDPRHHRLDFWESTQNPHPLRTFLAQTLSMPESSIRVVQPRVGGGFGLKQPPFQEEPLVAHMSRLLGRPVKWIEERDENFQATGHSRDVRFDYEVAFTDDGIITGLRAKVTADVGAPTALLGWGQSFVTGYCLPGVYRIPSNHIQLFVVVTNKCPWNSYRGFGKDSASLLMDRIVEHVTRETGLNALQVRSRNFIPADAFPYSQPSGAMLDSGDYQQVMNRLAELADLDGFPALQRAAREQGRRIGMGIGQELTPEGCAMPGAVMISAYDGATVRIAPSGDVTVLTGVTSPGCGNETAMAQIAADTLGCQMSRVSVIQGDTDICPYGLGNYSSRATMYGGSAVQLSAGQLRDKLLRVAAKMLEADLTDLQAAHGQFSVAGAPGRSVDFDEVVNQIYRYPFGAYAEDEEPGLEATRYFRMGNIYHQPEKQGRFSNYPAWPNGLVACIVEVDEETGHVKILRWFLVEDAGTIINPLLADANLHGAIAQGIGSAMFERISYDADGQLQTATLMDYTIPTAVELPRFDIAHVQTPSPFTPLGMKGIGESGVGSALGALCNAVENAFPELELSLDALTLTPCMVWRAIRDARRRAVQPEPAGSRD
jgi:aerobic carbon-monoxide dehydrogenase large subunit